MIADVKEKGTDTRRSEYGDYKPGVNGKKGTYERTIKYDKGIMAEHIMASASVPEHYDYTLVPKEYDYTKTENIFSIHYTIIITILLLLSSMKSYR